MNKPTTTAVPGVILSRNSITTDALLDAMAVMAQQPNEYGTITRWIVVHPNDVTDAEDACAPIIGTWIVQPDADATAGTFWLVDAARVARDGHDIESAVGAATLAWWVRVWDLLVRHGARESSRREFLDYHLGRYSIREPDAAREFRWMGKFGGGGKLYSHGMRSLYVGYYSEDRTHERDAIEAEINAALAAM